VRRFIPSSRPIVGYLGPVSLTEQNFSRSFGPNRMAIPAAAEFLFCRFRRFREIRGFPSDRQSESPLSRCFGSHQEICPVRVTWKRIWSVRTLSRNYRSVNGCLGDLRKCSELYELSETLGGVGGPSRRYYKILGGPPNTPV
jgi:hypothetical protein